MSPGQSVERTEDTLLLRRIDRVQLFVPRHPPRRLATYRLAHPQQDAEHGVALLDALAVCKE